LKKKQKRIFPFSKPTNRDLVRRDIIQGINSPMSNLILKLLEYYYNDGNSKELLCLTGTVGCQYKGNRYNIPVEIWLQQDHPNIPPLAYVKPTSDMHVSPTSKDVLPDGTVIIPYIKKWRHVKDLFLYFFFKIFFDFILAK
jgi:ESCRT-I complex subunit TSG101